MTTPAPDARCLTENELAEIADGRSPPETVALFEEHFDSCDVCRTAIGLLTTRAVLSRSRATAKWTTEAPFADLRDVSPDAYEVNRELARGGMGRILEAYDRRHARRVAIKVLLRDDAASHARFVREADLTARLQHPHIVTLYEAGRWSEGEPF